MYKVYVSNWWKPNAAWPNGLEPDGRARKHTLGYAETEDEARAMCKEYNETHKPGKLSRKAAYTSAYLR